MHVFVCPRCFGSLEQLGFGRSGEQLWKCMACGHTSVPNKTVEINGVPSDESVPENIIETDLNKVCERMKKYSIDYGYTKEEDSYGHQ